MKRTATALLTAFAATALCAGPAGTSSTPKGWIDDYDEALSRARAENKLVLADFTGSDWCGWCIKLSKEVLDTDEFINAVSSKYVLLYIDVPKNKSLLGEKAKAQNPKLVKKYGIKAFPSVLVLDANGAELASTGYQKGGPSKYIEHLSRVMRKNSPDYEKFKNDPECLKALEPTRTIISEATGRYTRTFAAHDGGDTELERNESMLKANEKGLPELRKALEEAKATDVPNLYADIKAEEIEAFERIVKDTEELSAYLRRKVEKLKRLTADPDYAKAILPIRQKLEAAQEAFEKTVARKMTEAKMECLPEYRRALEEAKAMAVPDGLSEAKDELLEKFDWEIEKLERSLR